MLHKLSALTVKCLLFNRDSIFDADIVRFVKAIATKLRRIAYLSPWQNSVGVRIVQRPEDCPRSSLRRSLQNRY